MRFDLRDVLSAEVPFQGRRLRVGLQPPNFRDTLCKVLEPAMRNPERTALYRELELYRWLAEVDSEVPAHEEILAITRDPEASEALREARTRFFVQARDQGRYFAKCPHCDPGEVELDLTGLSMAVDSPPWPIVTGSGELAVPALAFNFVVERRPDDAALSPSARAVLPSTRVGLAAGPSEVVLQACDPSRVDEAMTRWEEPFSVEVNDRQHWTRRRPSFRAAIRLLDATRACDALADPGDVDRMPAVDFYFLDALYALLYLSPSAGPARLSMVTCPRCSQGFSVFGSP